MNADDRIRAAFSNLVGRSRALNTTDALGKVKGEPRNSKFFPAVAAGLSITLLVGVVAIAKLFRVDGDPISPPEIFTTTTTLTPSPDSTMGEDPLSEAGRFRVNYDLVSGDPEPYLNVRNGAGVDAEIIAKLPPSYTGLVWTGAAEMVGESEWFQVRLLDPVLVTSPEVVGSPTGWVNSHYLEELPEGLPVTVSELLPCSLEGGSSEGGATDQNYLYSLDVSRIDSTCLRIVVGFAAGDAPLSWDGVLDSAESNAAPPTHYQLGGTESFEVSLPGTRSVWMGATEDLGVFAVRNHNRSISILYPGRISSSYVRTYGRWLVVDLETVGPEPETDSAVLLVGEPITGLGEVSFSGIGRPFEANLGIRVVDSSGNPVEAVFSGGYSGTVRASEYSVMTTDWTEAWGRFELLIEGLEVGSYRLQLTEGGVEKPPTEIPFIIEEAGNDPPIVSDEANRLGMAFVNFGSTGFLSPDLKFAPEVVLRLGFDESVVRSAEELSDPRNWVLDFDEFQGFSGPFNIPGLILSRPNVRITEGLLDHCSGPPQDFWPEGSQIGDPINIEPIGIDSCIQWYGVALLTNEDGLIQEVVLDLYGP